MHAEAGPGSSDGSRGGGAAPQGRSGGTLAIALLDPGPLDPARADRLEDEIVLGNLFDGLTAIDPAGAVRPAVAASWTSDPSLRRWEFRLRPDARWSDGSPVRSTDFTYAWQRLADPKTEPAPPPARTLLSGVTGYRAFAAGRARSIAGLETPDPATLVVRLDRPFADLPALVAALPLSPLPAALARPDPAAYLAHPAGNGPFRLAAPARPGRSLTLERNPAYQASPALLDKVSVHVVPDEQTAWLELQNGRVAFAPVPPDQLPAARTVHGLSPDGRTTPGLLNGPTLTTWQLTFNLKSKLGATPPGARPSPSPSTATSSPPPWPDRRRRPWSPHPPLAVGRAVVRGRTRPARRAPTTRPRPAPCSPRPRRVAPRSPWPSRPAPTPAASPPRSTATSPPPGSTWRSPRPPTGETPLTLVRRVAPYPRPDPFLAAPASTSPDARRLLDQARATPDDPTRATLYQQTEAAILADLPATPLLTEHHAAVLTPGPQGFNLTPWGTLDLATVSLPA